MPKLDEALQTLGAKMIAAHGRYGEPWPDWDASEADSESPQRDAAVQALEAWMDFLRAALPGVPTGVVLELLAAIADAGEGLSPRLFRRPRQAGGRKMPIMRDCDLALMCAVTTLLINGGWREEDAVRSAARAGGLGAETLKRYRDHLADRPGYIRELHSSILKYFRGEMLAHYIRSFLSNTGDGADPSTIDEMAGQQGLEVIAERRAAGSPAAAAKARTRPAKRQTKKLR